MRGSRRAARRTALAALLLCSLAPRPCGAMGSAGSSPGNDLRATVLFVADGDTVRVHWKGVREWVRLLRIDTPERGEEGYEGAREALVGLVDGREVHLVFEQETVAERDRYGRLLAYLFLEGRNVNVEMVRRGWSPFWTPFGEGRFAASFRSAEAEARRHRRGVWGSVDTTGD